MRAVLLLATVLVATVPGLREPGAAPQQLPLTPRDSALHALDRLAYGPRPGEVDRVAAGGVLRWIDQQIDARGDESEALATSLGQFRILRESREDLARVYFAAVNERRAQKLGTGGMDSVATTEARRLGMELQQVAITRALFSERQLDEVMVDFWTNHFNVFLGKGADRFLLPDYIEHTIRPRALGHFADLLTATAQSSAMMFYLDNWESVAPGSAPPRRGRGPGRVGANAQMPQGINENYARELLELHALGVEGGYTQTDVINVARIFTGWSIARPRQGGGFEFHSWAHDRGEKVVMGVRYPAGHDMDEGLRLLKWLAVQPATMRHVGHQLCQRFVSDAPSDGCVDDVVVAWRRSDGDLREVLRAIFHGPDFWAAANVGAKVKTPLGFVVSALRAVRAEPDSTPRLARVVGRLGEPLYLHVAPDGYAEREADWINSGALLDRMNAAVALAAGKLPGVQVDLDSIIPVAADGAELVAAVNSAILNGTMTENTKKVIGEEIADLRDPTKARALAVGLALGGPEFQHR
jgi:uncharacterized protein (DUF1800 family)